MTKRNKRILILLPLSLLVIFVGWRIASAGKGKEKTTAAGPLSTPVQVVVLKQDTSTAGIRVTGTLLPNEQVSVRAEVSGRVASINFEEGSKVQKGQLLVRIDDSELQAQLERNKAELQLAESEAKRREQLQSIGGISREEYEQAFTRVQTLRAEQQRLSTLRSRYGIYAPFSGHIGLRQISLGSYVSPQDPVATLLQMDPIKVEFNVPEQYAGEISDGMPVNLEFSDGHTASATVYARDPGIDPLTRTVKVRARAANTAGKLIPGSFAEVVLPAGRGAAGMSIPTEAIISEIDGSKVMIVKNGAAVKVPVETGQRGPRNISLISGVAAGDTVIITGLLTLREGSPVSPIVKESEVAGQ